MEAHKTCFTPLNEMIRKEIYKIGRIHSIQARYCAKFDLNALQDWNLEKNMGGSFYDVGVYPLCYSNFIANSKIKKLNFDVKNHPGYECDLHCLCQIIYENGIVSEIESSWINSKENYAMIQGENGRIEILNFWKNTEALLTTSVGTQYIKVEQKSDFTGEINHAIECIENHLLESPIMSEKASIQISDVLEEMKRVRN